MRLSPDLPHITVEEMLKASRKVREDMVEKATYFFKSDAVKNHSVERRGTFLLREKDLTLDEVRETIELVGLVDDVQKRNANKPLVATASASSMKSILEPPTAVAPSPSITTPPHPATAAKPTEPIKVSYPTEAVDVERVAKAANFLQSPGARTGNTQELNSFLKKQGLNDTEIRLAHEQAPRPKDDTEIERAVEFLRKAGSLNAVDSFKLDEFLLKKGLTEDGLKEAKLRAGVVAKRSPPGVAPPSNFDRAVQFLQNPVTKNESIEKKVEFLRLKGVSEEDINRALSFVNHSTVAATTTEEGLLSKNPTNATSVEATESFEDKPKILMPPDSVMLKKLAPLVLGLRPPGKQLLASRSALLSAIYGAMLSDKLIMTPTADYDELVARGVVLAFSEACNSMDFKPTEKDEDLVLFETCVAEMLDVGPDSLRPRISLLEAVIKMYKMKMNASVLPSSRKLDLGLSLSRCFHGHFCARASVLEYRGMDVLKEANSGSVTITKSDELSLSVYSFVLCAFLRGSVDFGCGVGAPQVPKTEKNEKNVTPEKDARVAINATAKKIDNAFAGLACTYAGIVWLDAKSTWSATARALFEGSLAMPIAPRETIDEVTDTAKLFVNSAVFRLAATVAQVLVELCTKSTSPEELAKLCAARAFEHSKRVFEASRANQAVKCTFAKRAIDRTYDEKQSQLTLEEALGTHASLGRLCQTHYLVLVVVIEPCLRADEAELSDALAAWDAVSNLGFALVPVPEAVRLNKWMETLVTLNSNPDEAFAELASLFSVVGVMRSSLDPTAEEDDEAKDDWILAGKLEYILDSAKQLLRTAWVDKTAWTAADAISKTQDKLLVDEYKALESLCHALIFGASHPFSHLNYRAHAWVSEGLAASKDKCNPDDDAPSLLLAMLPAYLDHTAKTCPRATDTSSFAYIVGATLTALSTHPDPRSQPLSISLFNRVLKRTRASCLAKPPTRETKTKAKTLSALVFASLKAFALPALGPSLDGVEIVMRTLAFEEMKSGLPASIKYRDAKQDLFDVASNIDDAPRRALLVMWYFKRIAPIGGGQEAKL